MRNPHVIHAAIRSFVSAVGIRVTETEILHSHDVVAKVQQVFFTHLIAEQLTLVYQDAR